jgi:hypothetical protein
MAVDDQFAYAECEVRRQLVFVTAEYVPNLEGGLARRTVGEDRHRRAVRQFGAADLTRHGPLPERNRFQLVYIFN